MFFVPRTVGFAFFFFFKQKTAYEIYLCDWSSDVCSSDLFTSAASDLSRAWTLARTRLPAFSRVRTISASAASGAKDALGVLDSVRLMDAARLAEIEQTLRERLLVAAGAEMVRALAKADRK